MSYRSAALPDALPFLERAEKNCAQPNQELGLNYCKGLYEWYSANPNNALRYFNNARRSPEFGQQAICFMIEICLNPDNDLPNENVQETTDDVSVFFSLEKANSLCFQLIMNIVFFLAIIVN